MENIFKTAPESIETNIKEIVNGLLKNTTDSLDLNKSFLDLGINSVLAVELVEAINQRIEIQLGIEVIFDYRGIKELAEYIYLQYGREYHPKFSNSSSAANSHLFIEKSKLDSGSENKSVTKKEENNNLFSKFLEESSDIAIIGISGKFAGSETIEKFWEHLQAGDSCIEEINRKGWEESRYYDPNPAKKNKSISKWGGFLKDIDKFDPSFFDISPLEAKMIEPQQRLFMEEAFKAFEDGGYSAEQLSGKKVGVFVGGRASDYKEKTLLEEDINSQIFLGNDMSILASRISYFFNLKGPSLTVDTACSSSLVAIHLACESVRKGESEIALVGGVFVLNSPEFYIMTSKTNMLSPNGKCKTFDNSADGIVLGEGVGALLIKRLKAAIEDGDHIYGVIKGSAINQAGKTNGITAPSMLSQKALIYEAYKNASINPQTISYIEAHGTGTKLGDLIEIKALTEAFRMFTDKTQFCAIGSHKPNFGHTIMSAGIAEVFTILMAFKHRNIPPTISVKQTNEHMDFNESPFFINTKLREWKSNDGTPLRAGVSSFGFSGTNCHLIIEEPPIQKSFANNRPVRPYYFFSFSAKTTKALSQKVTDMGKWLEKEAGNYSADDISYTLLIGRSHYAVRCVFIARDIEELKQKIMEVNNNVTTENYFRNDDINSRKTEPILKEYGDRIIEELREGGNLTKEAYKEKLIVLSGLYIKGCNLNWGNLFNKNNYRRIPLPLYPFMGESYFLQKKTYRLQNYKIVLNNQGDIDELMKKDKSLSIEGINLEELVVTYPETIPSHIHNIRNNIIKQSSHCKPLKFKEDDLQIKEMNAFLCRLLFVQLQSIGLFTEKKTSMDDLKRKTKLCDMYERWFKESITVLERNNYLRYDGESYNVFDTTPMDKYAVWKEWDRKKGVWLKDPNTKAQVVLVEAMLRALPEILTGKKLATDIMFPNSSMELVEGIYKNNFVADYFNEVLADTVVVYIQERLKHDSSARIRILEIGAGTGGTSAMVFQKLKPYQDHIQEYCYTDISKAFLMYAEKEYSPQNPYLTYSIFNVEAPINGQGISAGGYDVVIASNVLHATKYIRQTLCNAKVALRKYGLILINEITANSLFLHLTSGLLAGWWLYEDLELRIPGCPGLYPEIWQEVLESEGFKPVFFPAQEAHELGQQIVVGESDGIVRQNLPLKPNVTPVKHSIRTSRLPNRREAPCLAISKDKHLILQETKTIQVGIDVTDQMVEDHVRETIIEKLSESLKLDIDMIDINVPFADYGVDSITGVNLVRVLNQSLMIELETIALFDYISINQLTIYILSQYKNVIIKALGDNIKNRDISHDLPAVHKEKQSAYSFPKRLSRRRMPEKLDNQKIRESSGNLIQKDPIAIIGMSGRFAKSRTVNDLWEHLSKGTDLIEKVSRWDLSKYCSEETNYFKQGSFLEDIEQFDPLFFNISGLEATYMDPQQRLFLEESWKALEDAGYAGTGVKGCLCGVYVGCIGGDYQQLFEDNPPAQAFWGNMGSVIPARIAYYLDLQGPAVAVDTACSSSLVAIHLACQGLWARETELALAGGVFIQSSPGFFLAANRAGMLSPTGRCYTFDERADGFVPGEGVGVVVLKRLKKAIEDGDHIYGVIRGSGINQDGATNGITAPSANSQERLECQVYNTFNIDPGQIQMVEAHGTGTKLGDPIEYQALTRAFKKYTDKKEYCAIGSIKTNIGHTQIAAGVAGVIKILLSLQHKQIPPSLHFQSGNSNIQFKDSPFYVNTSLKAWDIEPNSKRCAVISSFGASGTNAHMVIEEAPKVERRHSEKPGYLIVLSARTFKQLQQQVEQLVEFCERGHQVDCGNMSYTLLLGRKHFNHRLVCVVRSQNELVKLFKKWLGKSKVSQIYISELHENDHREQPSFKQYGNQCIQNCQNANNASDYLEHLSAIAELYVQGYALEFEKLFSNEQYCRISLPTYPFARERYWVPEISTKPGSIITSAAIAASIHPLLHQNTSDLSEQRFSSTFTGREFFLANHIVKGQRVLPGAAYLEMARAAVEQAAGVMKEGQIGIRLKNVVWAQPIAVGEQAVQVHIGLFPEDNGEITYEIYSEIEEVNAEPVVHSQGRAALSSVVEVPTLDLPAIQAQFAQSTLSSIECYEVFRSMGLEYGPGHQGIEKLYVGSEQVLAKLSLPSSVSDTGGQFVLHPSLMDSALQASLMMSSSNFKPVLPFALKEIEILGSCISTMWVLIRYTDGSKAGDKVQKLDIDLCDEQGTICVRMKGFSARLLEGEVGSVGDTLTIGTLMAYPSWKEQAVTREASAPNYAQHLVMVCEPGEVSPESIQAQMNGVRCLTLQSERQDIEERFQSYAVRVFEEIQSILKDKPKGKALVQIVVPGQNEQQLFSGLSGLLKTARLENPKLIGQLVEVEPGEDSEGIIERLKENSRSPLDNHIRYLDGKRYVAGWSEIDASRVEGRIPWKDRGVYLITGGAGGLGLIFSKEVAHKVKDATLILTGRSPLNKNRQAKLKELEALGVRIEYRQVDGTQKEEVDGLIQSIREDFGELNGIIHGAGVIQDNFILKKTKDEFLEVLAPKVTGLVNLDRASKDLPLDFFILFSSISGGLGNPGQADYAAANAFMDAYAGYRNALVASKQRRGQTLSINWPLWQEGGMNVDEETEKMIRQSMGMSTMQTSTGISALYQGIVSGKDQVMVMEGKLSRMRQKLLSLAAPAAPQPEKASATSATTGIDTGSLLDKVQAALLQTVSKLLKVKINDIDADTEINEYGFDSITLTQFANKLNQEYKLELTPTIFFEHPTLRSFAEYLIEEHQAVFAGQFATQTKAETPGQAMADEGEERLPDKRRRSRFAKTEALSKAKPEPAIPEPIAIVGMSGIFPMARDVHEFWRNLAEGRDCITEIPKDRWDWREYYGDPAKEANKTNIKWGGFIDGVDEFDPLFFGISPREAEFMDPQQRLLMTYVWKAVEEAGYSARSLWGTKTAIFVGTAGTGYSSLVSRANVAIEGYSSTGMVSSVGPNRMSYFLNIHGSSEPIETACSSSLVAIHRAVKAIENGSCEMAIAGGVNTILTPELHISFNKAGMLCEDGRCKTFSDQANGYVRGEGVGMLFLKKLKAAEEAGDHIYGVIRGVAENHGGRANSLTAPNPKAQAELLVTAYTKAGVDPRTVTYIEAHGTGTELGDPIEINGLKTAFKELCQATGDSETSAHCGLGSVKTNIGHLELAAGIAGVIKVLLQLKHKTLAKSLHCDTINPYIQLKDSPFYIVRETKEWKPLQDASGKDLPRRAGVSSFGFGGANAHVVIEEYIPKDLGRSNITITPQNPAIIVLSARNEERLREQVQQLLAAVQERQFSDAGLADMAYTLQVGREAMEERLAIIAGSVKELEEKLRGFVEGREDTPDLYRGQLKRNKETLAVFAADEELQEAIDKWIQRRKYAKLLDFWVRGLNVDWNKLYSDTRPSRVSLPTYPFARERYWIPETDTKVGSTTTGSAITASIHPLLHQNTSDLSEQRFSSTFTGREFFLADHVLKGQRVLPGAAYLEMARAAVERAIGASGQGQAGMRLKNVVWARPIAVGEQPVQVHIGLYPEENGWIAYEIYSESKSAEPVVYSQGSAVLNVVTEAPTIDIKALQAQCTQSTLLSTQCYEAFKAMGLVYGPGYQGIEAVYVGAAQMIAKLSLPFSISNTEDQFVLHPSLMDAAFQATVLGFMMDTGNRKLSLPFALQDIEIYGSCASAMWALIRHSEGSTAGDKVEKLDIDLCDDQGTIRVRMKGFSSRVLEGELGSAGSSVTLGTLLLHPCWKERAIAREATTPDYDRHLVMLCEPDEVSQENIETKMNGVRCLTLHSEQNGIEERFQTYATQAFEEIQSVLKDKPKGKVLIQMVVSIRNENQLFSGLSGLLKTARLENPKLIVQLLEVEPGEDSERIIEKLKENSRSPVDNRIRYQAGKRMLAGWSEVDASRDKLRIPWEDQGVYLITGGAGGLGLIIVKEIASKVKNATMILTGRSPLDEEKQVKLKELETLGARIEYKQVDVTQKKAVISLLQRIQENYGNLNGIIHGAGVIRDNFILKKSKEELQEVLAPKVTGLVNLDHASKDLPLNFFIFFSSGAGAMGNIGQADYAAANAFMDAYAVYRNALVASKQRQGQTLSINWPLWKEGGMHVDEETEMMMQSMGMMAMKTSAGIRALYQSIASGKDQVMVMEGNVMKLRNFMELGSMPSEITKPKEKVSVTDDSLKIKTLIFVKQTLANAIKLSPEKIQEDNSFEKYGLDSIMQIKLIRELEKVTGELSKTLLFEHSNTQELTDYLVKNHSDKLLESIVLGDEISSLKTPNHSGIPDYMPSSFQKKHRFLRLQGADQILTKQDTEDIAIIGISGRYPLSNSLEELWEHLKAGHNCITEAPNYRWSTSLAQALSGDKLKYLSNRYYGGFLDPINRFDHHLFEIALDKVRELSPEVRLFLEVVWETFEDAGYTRLALQELQTRYQKGVGVFIGAMYSQYPWSIPSLEHAALSSNVTDWQIANRTSHSFNLTGPSIAINSACSSSLTAIHFACESLKQKTCSMAIAGGINLTLDPSKYDSLQQTKLLGSGNQSKSFGTGDGYIPGEGVGAVLLKPLPLAIKDHDRIYAVIKSSFVNHSGNRQMYGAPDPKQQAKLILDSIQRSGIDPVTIGYVESAANGSELGDPIEVIALNNAFEQYTEKRQYCALGSIKSNLGHLEAASGISQLSKVLLQLQHKTLVPTINASPRNSNINLEDTAFYLQEEAKPWSQFKDPQTGKSLPRRSMINSFGAGGAYANLIVEEFAGEASIQVPSVSSSQEHLIVFSAKTEWSLMEYLQKILSFLEKNSSIKIESVARSLLKTNHTLVHRVAILASSIQELMEKLNLLKENRSTLSDAGVYISLDQKPNMNSINLPIIQQALEKKDVWQLAQYWVKGATIELRQLYEDPEVQCIALPKYAFDHNIEFNFDNKLEEFSDKFYLELSEKILEGELSKDQFLRLILM